MTNSAFDNPELGPTKIAADVQQETRSRLILKLVAGVLLIVLATWLGRQANEGEYLYVNALVQSSVLTVTFMLAGGALTFSSLFKAAFRISHSLGPRLRMTLVVLAVLLILFGILVFVLHSLLVFLSMPGQAQLEISYNGSRTLELKQAFLLRREHWYLRSTGGWWFTTVNSVSY